MLSAQRLMAMLAPAGTNIRTDEPSIAVVVITGLTLVFGILILLYLILLLEGKIFQSIDKKKQEKGKLEALTKELEETKAALQAAQDPAQQQAALAAAAAAATAAVQGGISSQVVAAIMGAISAELGGDFIIQSINQAEETVKAAQAQPAGKPAARGRRGQWGTAGVAQNTEPF